MIWCYYDSLLDMLEMEMTKLSKSKFEVCILNAMWSEEVWGDEISEAWAAHVGRARALLAARRAGATGGARLPALGHQSNVPCSEDRLSTHNSQLQLVVRNTLPFDRCAADFPPPIALPPDDAASVGAS